MHKEGAYIYFDFVFNTLIPYGDMAGAKVRRQWGHHRIYFSPFTSSSVRSEKKNLVTVHTNIKIPQLGISLVTSAYYLPFSSAKKSIPSCYCLLPSAYCSLSQNSDYAFFNDIAIDIKCSPPIFVHSSSDTPYDTKF